MGKNSCAGFSLLEIVIALALFVIVITSLLQFFAFALKFHRDTQASTRAVFIAKTIFNVFETTQPDGILLTNKDGFSNPVYRLSVLKNIPSTYDIAYDSQGEPIRLLSAKEALAPLREKGMSSIAHIFIFYDAQYSDIFHFEITISSPGNKKESQRHHSTFCKLIHSQDANPPNK